MPTTEITKDRAKIKSNLNENRKRQMGQKETYSSYTVLTSEKVMSIVGNILGIIQAVIIGFASIAIIVGGIGIMNTMYTSVTERIKEIGIMKAIGATNKHIMSLFIIEAALFGVVGGVIGIALGSFGAYTVKVIASYFGFELIKIAISPGLVAFSLAFSIGVGMISGFIPAYQAAKLKPVEALQYE